MESLTHDNEKIGRHHMNLRKRKCTVLGKNKSFSNKAISLNSYSSKAKADDNLGIPTHAIGRDGHFYECMKCEDVGQLLCCDTCSCTYHLNCLNPPLESTPEGDWHCPNCSDNDNLSKATSNLGSTDSNKRRTWKEESNSSFSCSLCSKIKKILILNEDEAVMPIPCSIDQLNSSVGFDKYALEYRGGPSVPDAGINGTINQQTPNNNGCDKLLILRDVLQEAVQGLENTAKTNNEARDTMNQLIPVDTQSGQLQKDKAKLQSGQKEKLILRITSKGARPVSKLDLQRQSSNPVAAQTSQVQKDENASLHSRLKGKQILRNTSKGAYSGSKLDAQKQSSDLQMVKYGESVTSNALANDGIGADAQRSSLMTRSGQTTTIPNISLPKTNPSAASGFTSSTSCVKNIDTVPSGRPYGFLEYNAISWSALELDALWVGVRRYGQEDWNAILADPSLKVLKNKTPQDLSLRWKDELLKILSFQKPTSSLPSAVLAERSKPTKLDIQGMKFKDATTMQLLPPKVPFPSLKYGNLGSYDQGSSSSRASPSFPRARDIDSVPPHWVTNLNNEPVISELLFQTLNHKANPDTKMRLMGMQAFPTPGVAMATQRRSSFHKTDQPKLFLGGYFPICKACGRPSNTKPNPSQVGSDED